MWLPTEHHRNYYVQDAANFVYMKVIHEWRKRWRWSIEVNKQISVQDWSQLTMVIKTVTKLGICS